MFRVNCTLQFPKLSEIDRDDYSQFKRALGIISEANHIDLRITEEREYPSPKKASPFIDIWTGFWIGVILILIYLLITEIVRVL